MRSQHIPSAEGPQNNSRPSSSAAERFAAAATVCGDELQAMRPNAPLSELFGPVARFAFAARGEVPPEKFLKRLKELLHETPWMATAEPDARDRLRKYLVSLAIEAFYAPTASIRPTQASMQLTEPQAGDCR